MLRRALVVVHRWLGVALCLVFLVWFLSGIGMMYFPMPEVGEADRLARAPALDPSAVHVSPAEAARTLGVAVDQLRLAPFNRRPAYRTARTRTGGGRVLYADTGDQQGPIARDMADAIAADWVGQPAGEARSEVIAEPDQWTLQVPLVSLAPVIKYEWSSGEHVYVSQASGEVVQYTTTGSRFRAYLGPIPHWFYFTPLRKHGPLWSGLVIWTSGIGTVAAILGIVIGLSMYSPSKAYRHSGAPTSLPYTGQKRWHAVLGLVFGAATVTYAFSGMLSMDPFPSRTARGASAEQTLAIERALSGQVEAAAYDEKPPLDVLRQLGDGQVRQLEFVAFAGNAFYLARLAGGETRLVPTSGKPADRVDPAEMARVLEAGTSGTLAIRVLDRYDRYYLDRHGARPLPVLLATSTDGRASRYYIDPRTIRIVATYDAADWKARWLYHALHSLDLPWLYAYRPLWDLVSLGSCSAGPPSASRRPSWRARSPDGGGPGGPIRNDSGYPSNPGMDPERPRAELAAPPATADVSQWRRPAL